MGHPAFAAGTGSGYESRRVMTASNFLFTGNKGWLPHGPDFLRRFVPLIHSMRLSLMKGAHADLSCTAWQEIGVKPHFGLSGIPQHSTPAFSLTCTSDRWIVYLQRTHYAPTQKIEQLGVCRPHLQSRYLSWDKSSLLQIAYLSAAMSHMHRRERVFLQPQR
jgi:hypothetical protein